MPDKKVIPLDDRIPALQSQRKKRANRRLIFYLTFFFLLILFVVYFQSPLSHIRHITVEGAEHVDERWIVDESGIKIGNSMWNIDKEEAMTNIHQLEEVADVHIERSLPSTIHITITEHERIAYVDKNGRYIPVLENGTILTEQSVSHIDAEAPILHGFSDETLLRTFTEELSKLGDGVANRISEVHLTEQLAKNGEVHLYMTDGIEVISTIASFSEHMATYPAVAQEIDPNEPGVLHMKMSPYFESFEVESEDEEQME